MNDLLSGWSDIGKYLRVSSATAQRYERDLDLPVRRRGQGPRAPVYAFRSDIDDWQERLATGHVKRGLLRNHAQRAVGFAEKDRPFLEKIRSLSNVTLYRRNYHMRFDLERLSGGVRANVSLTFELLNASGANQPHVQEITLDDSDHGRVIEMAALKNGTLLYALQSPLPTERKLGYSVYRGRELSIEPENTGASYSCRASWIIKRGEGDLWYNHMVLPTVGVTIETHAPPDFEITPTYSEPGLKLIGEHLDIAWRRGKS